MICFECGAHVRSINFKHLKSCCGLTPQDYLAKHPGASLIDDDVRTAISRPGEQNPNWQGGKTIKHCACGKRLSRHNRSGFCVSCTRRGERNPFHGKQHGPETQRRMQEGQRSRDRSTYRGGGADPKLLSELRRQEWARRTPEEKQRHLRAFIAAGQIHNKKSSRTTIETVVAEMLSALGFSYQPNVQLGQYNVDFLVGRTIIECFGDFWHCNPAIWAEGDVNKSIHLTARQKWEKDRERRTKLEAMGYRFIVFWESDILRAPEVVRSRLRALQEGKDENAAQN